MPDPKSRARVQRLLDGAFRPDDLTALFLFARDHCDGRETVSEIGHFVAHHQERNKGIITKATRDWYTVMKFHLYSQGNDIKLGLDPFSMPPATKDYFEIAAKRLDPKIIMRETNLRQGKAHQIMHSIAARLQKNSDGTWMLPRCSEIEQTVVRTCCKYITIKPAFTGDDLGKEFIATLKSNGLISKDELRIHTVKLMDIVQLYAVSAMHNCVVQLDEVAITKLEARIEGGTIHIMAPILVYMAGYKGSLTHISSMFSTTNIDPSAHCQPELIKTQHWNFDLEVGLDQRLSRLH